MGGLTDFLTAIFNNNLLIMENFQVFFEQIKSEMARQTNDIISQMDKKLTPFTNEIEYLKLENQKLKEKLLNIERNYKKNNIIIYGLEENENSVEELMEKTRFKIKNDLNISFDSRDIDIIHRIGKKGNDKNNKMRPVLISLVNGWKKKEIMVNKRMLTGAYASHDLTKEELERKRQLRANIMNEKNNEEHVPTKDNKTTVKQKTIITDKRKRNLSISPNNPGQRRNQYISSKANRVNAFDVMIQRSNSVPAVDTPVLEHSS